MPVFLLLLFIACRALSMYLSGDAPLRGSLLLNIRFRRRKSIVRRWGLSKILPFRRHCEVLQSTTTTICFRRKVLVTFVCVQAVFGSSLPSASGFIAPRNLHYILSVRGDLAQCWKCFREPVHVENSWLMRSQLAGSERFLHRIIFIEGSVFKELSFICWRYKTR